MPNILDTFALLSLIPSLLPDSDKKLQTPQDGLAALSHSILSALAFRLVAVDDSSPITQNSNNTLPTGWNKNGPGNYTFRYKHDQSSLDFLLKISNMGSRLLFNAIATESDKVASLDISTNNFISPASFPHDLSEAVTPPLVHCFISSARVTDFVSEYKLKVIQKLVPGLRKDGYTEETTEQPSHTATRLQQSNDNANRDTRPQVPQFPRYDPYGEFPGHGHSHLPPQYPLQIGRRDLDPLPGGSFQPPPLFPLDNDDGMLVGRNHPIFGGRSQQPGARGPWGGDGFLPPMGAPPGARFDPVGPTIGPFPGNLGLSGRGRGNVPGGGNMRSPDNDELMPPGFGDMYM